MKWPRRGFLEIFSGLIGLISLRFVSLLSFGSQSTPLEGNLLRPPGALPEKEFNLACIRCGACSSVCMAGCIQMVSVQTSLFQGGTPFLDPRLKACNLCMNCTQVCPTGALQPISDQMDQIAKTVRMGKARVLKGNCLSFNGRICGVCHDACPLKGSAIVLKRQAQPEVIEKFCIGCGRCEERCPQLPSAIIVRRVE